MVTTAHAGVCVCVYSLVYVIESALLMDHLMDTCSLRHLLAVHTTQEELGEGMFIVLVRQTTPMLILTCGRMITSIRVLNGWMYSGASE